MLKIFISFLFSLSLIGCNKNKEDYFPYKQGLTWTYSIDLFSSYTGKKSEKRLLITNIKTHKKKDGIEVVRLHSNGNYYTYWLDRYDKKLSRSSVILKTSEGLVEPVNKDVYPDVLFKKNKWVTKEQLFLTKGYQPPVRNFRPETKIDMTYFLKKKIKKFKHRGAIFNNCNHIIGNGTTSFIADDRSGPLKVDVKSEEWICSGVGTVLEKRYEDTKASAFGKTSFVKELIHIK